MDEHWTSRVGTRPEHIREISFDGVRHNNKMERMNGEIRDREKVTRNLKTLDTPILTGMQIYYNYVRPHMALEGKTPAELAGIELASRRVVDLLVSDCILKYPDFRIKQVAGSSPFYSTFATIRYKCDFICREHNRF
jgi:hypothetical protein